ncbi:MAG: Ig-like domain-containing protein [Myxococcaceae bacterium]
MKRVLCLLALTGCLVPGSSTIGLRDVSPPVLLRTIPAADAGVLDKTRPLEIVFDEPLEPRSIIPGISVLQGETPVALVVAAETSDPYSDAEFHVTVQPGSPDAGVQPWAASTSYQLILNTLISDTEGHTLAAEIRQPFQTGL